MPGQESRGGEDIAARRQARRESEVLHGPLIGLGDIAVDHVAPPAIAVPVEPGVEEVDDLRWRAGGNGDAEGEGGGLAVNEGRQGCHTVVLAVAVGPVKQRGDVDRSIFIRGLIGVLFAGNPVAQPVARARLPVHGA